MTNKRKFDAIIIGSGVSGSYFAQELTAAGWDCLMLEAGKSYTSESYPQQTIDGSAQLFWNGGMELNTRADLAMLRAKVVGGGSVVNQALLDRFYPDVWEDWNQVSKTSVFCPQKMEHWYNQAESQLKIQQVPEENWNRNAHLFRQGCEALQIEWGTLRRGQNDCHLHSENHCIQCLNGCTKDRKQSTPVTSLARALSRGLELLSEREVTSIVPDGNLFHIHAKDLQEDNHSFVSQKIVLAGGSLGNTKILNQSPQLQMSPSLGNSFYTHPQNMVLGLYNQPINAHLGAFQTIRTEDQRLRELGFKLENVFVPPPSLAMLLPLKGSEHQEVMAKQDHLGCMEVAIQDTQPGRVRVNRHGKILIQKSLNQEDRKRMERGLRTINEIFDKAGASQIFPSKLWIGLHLMGSCPLGSDPKKAVVTPDFRLFNHPAITVADSSIFPSAPGINPSLTIMALSIQAAHHMILEGRT